MRWMTATMLMVAACGGDDSGGGDDCPAYANIVGGSFGRAGAITGGLGAVATGVAVALIMAGPLGGFGPAVWTGVAASAIGGGALVPWALRCSRVE